MFRMTEAKLKPVYLPTKRIEYDTTRRTGSGYVPFTETHAVNTGESVTFPQTKAFSQP